MVHHGGAEATIQGHHPPYGDAFSEWIPSQPAEGQVHRANALRFDPFAQCREARYESDLETVLEGAASKRSAM
ncbi:MAG: hypothetical protein WEF86_11530 [Gemmatimonadota bacterium]